MFLANRPHYPNFVSHHTLQLFYSLANGAPSRDTFNALHQNVPVP